MIHNPGDLESYTQYVYNTLLNLHNEGVVVGRRIKVQGNITKERHEIDVYYQFEKAGVIHKVAIECKFTARPVEKADVMEFHGKLNDIGNIIGIMVSKSGYQKGALNYGNSFNIELKTLEDLPTLNLLTAEQVKATGLPTKGYMGEPFWMLMERDDDNVSGSFFTLPDRHKGKRVIPLFFSKREAVQIWQKLPDKEQFAVRGIPQKTLNYLVEMGNLSKVYFMPVVSPSLDQEVAGLAITPDELKHWYLASEVSASEYEEVPYRRKPRFPGEITLSGIYREMKHSRWAKFAATLRRDK